MEITCLYPKLKGSNYNSLSNFLSGPCLSFSSHKVEREMVQSERENELTLADRVCPLPSPYVTMSTLRQKYC